MGFQMLVGSKIYEVEVGGKINVLRVCRGGEDLRCFKTKYHLKRRQTGYIHNMVKLKLGKREKWKIEANK